MSKWGDSLKRGDDVYRAVQERGKRLGMTQREIDRVQRQVRSQLDAEEKEHQRKRAEEARRRLS